MRVGNFGLGVPEGHERDSGHIVLRHGEQYTIRLMNFQGRLCDATVTVDGKSLGGFRIYPHNHITLERAPNDTGRFTFYAAGTDDARQAGEGSIATAERGLIQVRFVPEKRREPVRAVETMGFAPEREEKTSGERLLRGMGLAPGMTGVSGHSNQQFTRVPDLDGDESEAVTISVRLVSDDRSPRPLKPVTQANRVPDPV